MLLGWLAAAALGCGGMFGPVDAMVFSDAQQADLRELFEECGTVNAIRMTKTFSFIEMNSIRQAEKAMEQLNGYTLYDLPLAVAVLTLLEAVPVKRIVYPPSFERLEAVRDALLRDAGL